MHNAEAVLKNKSRKKKKIFLLEGVLTNYRVPVFKRLSAFNDIDLVVFSIPPTRAQRKEALRMVRTVNEFNHKLIPCVSIGSKILLPKFAWYIIKERPDIVILQIMDYLCLFICKLLKIPFIWWTSGTPACFKPEVRKGALQKLLSKMHIRTRIAFLSDAIIVYSESGKEYLISKGKSSESIFVAYNSMDTEELLKYRQAIEKNSSIVEKMQANYNLKGKKVILFVGRLIKSHRVDLLLNAFYLIQQHMNDVSLLIVGEGPEFPALLKLKKQLKLRNVFFLGPIYDNWELSKLFYLTDVYVIPGACSLTAKFAMTFSKPVVSVACGLEVYSIENGRNGFITTPGDYKEFANRILELLSNKELRERMGKGAYKTIKEKVNIHKMIKGFQDAIEYVSHGWDFQ